MPRRSPPTTKAQIGKELATLTAKADAEIAARSAESATRIREIEASAAESVTEVARATAAEIVAALGPRARRRGDDRGGGRAPAGELRR